MYRVLSAIEEEKEHLQLLHPASPGQPETHFRVPLKIPISPQKKVAAVSEGLSFLHIIQSASETQSGKPLQNLL